MSHNIEYSVYDEDVDKKSVQGEWDTVARCVGRGEGCSGLGRNIRWIEDSMCGSREEAEELIRKLDCGWYDQLAVRFREPSEPTKEMLNLRSRISEARAKYNAADSKFHFQDAKAELIGCKACGSRLARAHLKSNYCPLCRADLRPESTKQAIQRQADKIKELEEKLAAAEKKAAMKNGKIKWLVKIEYHT